VNIISVQRHFLRACSRNRFNRVSAIATSSSSATPDRRISRRSNVLQPSAIIDSPLVTSRQTRPDLPQLRAQIGAASDEHKRVVNQDRKPWCDASIMVKQGVFVLAYKKLQKVCVHTCCLSEPPSMIDLHPPPRHYQTDLSPSECHCSSVCCSTLQLSACKTSPYNGAKPVAKHSDDCAILRRQYKMCKVQQQSHSCLKVFDVKSIACRLSQSRLRYDSMHEGCVSCMHCNVCSLSDKAGAQDVVQCSGCICQTCDMLLVPVKRVSTASTCQEWWCEGVMLRQACVVQPHLRASTI